MFSWELYQYAGVYTEFCKEFHEDGKHADDSDLLAEVDQRLLRLREVGNQARMPVSEPLGDGLFCCRAASGKHLARLFYCFLPRKRIVILLCALKDQRRLSPKDIAEARSRKTFVEDNEETINGIT